MLLLAIVVMVPMGVTYIKEKAVLNHIVTESIPEDTFTGVSNDSLSLVEKLEILSSFSDKNMFIFQLQLNTLPKYLPTLQKLKIHLSPTKIKRILQKHFSKDM